MAGSKVPRDPNISPEVRRFLDDLAREAITNAAEAAPVSAPYVVISLDGTLTAERVLAVGTGLSLTDGGAGGNATLANTAPVAAGAVLQTLQTTYATNTNITDVIPFDDTAPTTSEGIEILSQAITLANAANKVLARVSLWGACSASGIAMSASLFRGSTFIQGRTLVHGNANWPEPMDFDLLETPGSVGPHTYSVRVGPSSGTLRMNGGTTGRLFGGSAVCTLTLMEIKG
jgi:hypothetical protein